MLSFWRFFHGARVGPEAAGRFPSALLLLLWAVWAQLAVPGAQGGVNFTATLDGYTLEFAQGERAKRRT